MSDKLSLQEFGDEIKSEYPVYKDIDSAELGQMVLDEYPVYKDRVDVGTKPSTNDKMPVSNLPSSLRVSLPVLEAPVVAKQKESDTRTGLPVTPVSTGPVTARGTLPSLETSISGEPLKLEFTQGPLPITRRAAQLWTLSRRGRRGIGVGAANLLTTGDIGQSIVKAGEAVAPEYKPSSTGEKIGSFIGEAGGIPEFAVMGPVAGGIGKGLGLARTAQAGFELSTISAAALAIDEYSEKGKVKPADVVGAAVFGLGLGVAGSKLVQSIEKLTQFSPESNKIMADLFKPGNVFNKVPRVATPGDQQAMAGGSALAGNVADKVDTALSRIHLEKQKMERRLILRLRVLDVYVKNPHASQKKIRQMRDDIKKDINVVVDLETALNNATVSNSLLRDIHKFNVPEPKAVPPNIPLPEIGSATAAPSSPASPIPPPTPLAGRGVPARPDKELADIVAINYNKLDDNIAASVVYEMARSPEFTRAWEKQKRHVVSRAESTKAGEKLIQTEKVTEAKLADLKPGQRLKAGTADAQTKAVKLLEERANTEFYEASQKYANGDLSLEEVAAYFGRARILTINAEALASEQGRAFGALARSPLDKARVMANRIAIQQDLMSEPEKFAKFVADMAKLPRDAIAIRRLMTGKIMKQEWSIYAVLRELRASGLLTSPITFMRNAVGNTAALASQIVEKPLAATSALRRGGARERFYGEATANVYGMLRSFGESTKKSISALLDESSLLYSEIPELTRLHAIPGPVGRGIRIPFRILNATDVFFKELIVHGELEAQIYRQAMLEGARGNALISRIAYLRKNLPNKAVDNAIAKAREFTFTENLGAASGMERWMNKSEFLPFLAKFIVPFIRTPANVARFALRRLPGTAGFQTSETVSIDDAVARNMVGMSALILGGLAVKYNENLLTGAMPKNKAKADALWAAGWRPYSVKVGDMYIPFQSFEPISFYLRMVADYSQRRQEHPDEDIKTMASKLTYSTVRGFADQTFLRSINDVLKVAEDPDRRGGQFIESLAGSLVPSLIAGASRSQDPYYRSPEGIWETMQSRVPSQSMKITTKLNIFGEPKERTARLLGLVDIPKSDPLAVKLVQMDLAESIGYPSVYINGRRMTDNQFARKLASEGPILKMLVSKMLDDPRFLSMPTIEQQRIIGNGLHNDKTGRWEFFGAKQIREHYNDIFRVPFELEALDITKEINGLQRTGLGALFKRREYLNAADKDKRKLIEQLTK